MSMLDIVPRLWRHAEWADAAILGALHALAAPPAGAVRECAHVFGAAEVWLSRIEGRPSRAAIWPEIGLSEVDALATQVHHGYARLFATLDERALDHPVAYTTSTGQSFETPVGDILLQVALHGQYHRGRINLLLRQAGAEPAPADYILFQRGWPPRG